MCWDCQATMNQALHVGSKARANPHAVCTASCPLQRRAALSASLLALHILWGCWACDLGPNSTATLTQALSLGSDRQPVQEGEPPVRPSGLEDLLHRLAEQAQLRGPDDEPVDLTAEQQEEQQRREHGLHAAVWAVFLCETRKGEVCLLSAHAPEPFCTCTNAVKQLSWEAQSSVSSVPSTGCPGRLPLSSIRQGSCLRWLGLTSTIAAELEQALLASMADDESQPTGPPPASKYAVRHLQKETLTEERLRQLGASDGVQCAVCRSAFSFRRVSGLGTGLQACPHVTHCHVGSHRRTLPRITLSVCSSHGQEAAHQARLLSHLALPAGRTFRLVSKLSSCRAMTITSSIRRSV